MRKLSTIAARLAAGTETSRTLVEECLARIADKSGEGERAFRTVYAEAARFAADTADQARRLNALPGPLAGIPISIKDLFDVAGETTQAGSHVLDDQPAAAADAPVVARLRAAGLAILGKTNMTEFAYSGLGMNAHFGTPRSPYDRRTGRIPGGSTSGGAVSVADGMAAATIGTDTGGSCRIPAALCGIVGFKPTASRVPRQGVVPLSMTMDSVGPLGASVECCALLDSVLTGGAAEAPEAFPLAGLRIGVPTGYMTEGLDDHVAKSFSAALDRLSKAGARIVDLDLSELAQLPNVNRKGGFVGAEAYAWHRPLLEKYADRYDPWILGRFEVGKSQTAADYIDLLNIRADIVARVGRKTATVDCVAAPTVAIVAPTLEAMSDRDVSMRTNLLLLRNAAAVNFLDRCALSIPCHEAGTAPVGLMLIGGHGADRHLLAIGRSVEEAANQTPAE